MSDKHFPIPPVPRTFGIEKPIVEPLPPFIEPVWVPQPVIFEKYIPRSTKCATVKIYTPDRSGFCVISEPEFNPHQHEIYQEPANDQA